ncbi:MAG: RnfABCDGE type electron transport complex subunit B [Nanoarchaeota archaeon]
MILKSVLVVSSLSLVFGLALAYFARRFQVKSQPLVEQIRKILPGANCGSCGLAGCDAFAEAVVAGKLPVNACIVGQDEIAQKIAAILGKNSPEKTDKKLSVLHCNGTSDNCSKRPYHGIQTCKGANLLHGNKDCVYACLGFGDCVKVCPVGCITMQDNGIPEVDRKNCVSCGKCVETCTKDLFELVPADKKVHVSCSSKDLGKEVIKVCRVGCIGCGSCERACPSDAIHVIDNIAQINYSNCINCGKCAKVCTRKIIVNQNL